MTPRQRFLNGLARKDVDRASVASPTSIVTEELQAKAGAYFPEAHHDPATMARLATAGHTICGYDVVFPVFGAGTQESAALGVPIWARCRSLSSEGCRRPVTRCTTDVSSSACL